MIDLDHAREVIEAEKCDTEDSYWCSVHEAWAQPAMDKCHDRPEVADVAADLLDVVERELGGFLALGEELPAGDVVMASRVLTDLG